MEVLGKRVRDSLPSDQSRCHEGDLGLEDGADPKDLCSRDLRDVSKLARIGATRKQG